MLKGTSKSSSKLITVLIIVFLLSSVLISILVLDHGFSGVKNKELGPGFGIEEPINLESEIPDNPTEADESVSPEEPNESGQLRDSEETPDLLELARVIIGNEEYFFDPKKVKTTRPDLFNISQFSIFDVLVNLAEQNEIDLVYYFDETMNTHIIEAINQQPGWWYNTYYSGGWPEQNVFRPDHYPWKPGTQLRFYKESFPKIAAIYSVWQQETQRLERNEGKFIIPEVTIRGKTFVKEFKNVEVSPHNLRNDVFKEDIITAIDVILSLAYQGKITYELQWYDYIGTARIVRSYWVEAINEDKAVGYCGFVYEAGSKNYRGVQGNHIHLPSDTRILNSPEYLEFFWICLDHLSPEVPNLP
jgi:hypothetical protein